MKVRCYLILLMLLFPVILCGQQIVINEVMSANTHTIADEDGDYPDWIELFNIGSVPVSLKGYFLTDDAGNMKKWAFPDVLLPPQNFLLLFASGKDRRTYVNFWHSVVSQGSVWRYRPGTSEPPPDWTWVGFDDHLWQSGATGIGWGDGDDTTVIDPVTSLYMRVSFHLNNLDNVVTGVFHMDYDDGFVAYLNGDEIARANLGEPGFIPPHNYPADTTHEAHIYRGEPPEMFVIPNIRSLLRIGENVLAVQVHNYPDSASASDLTAIPFLTLGLSSPPDTLRPPLAMLPFPTFTLHTNFRLKAGGEFLGLVSPSGQWVDLINLPAMDPDVSYGRRIDGSAEWTFFGIPTPGEPNDTSAVQPPIAPPVFSLESGFYNEPQFLSLSHEDPAAVIRYTLDGSIPDDRSAIYTSPIPVMKTSVVRARAFRQGALPSPVVNHSYFIGENTALPVFSLITDPDNLWNDSTGIYTMGPNASPDFPYRGANFWQDWERPVYLEFFESDRSLAFSLHAGMKIFGGWSRAYPQRSLAIYARKKYGSGTIRYQLFPDKPIKEFESFVLRNAGNDWNFSFMRDALTHALVKGTHLVPQGYRPVVVFINGQYWGIYNLREKINEHFIAANYGADPDSIDFLEYDDVVIKGDASHYHQLLDFIRTHDLTNPDHYDVVASMMDIENFIDYQITEIFVNNQDWPSCNIKFWRPKKPGGRWRWILFDTDFSWGLYYPDSYSFNSLAFATEPNGPDYPNPPWSTFLLRNLLVNPYFRVQFINRFADFMNTIFHPAHILPTISRLKTTLLPEMPRHLNRWNLDYDNWLREIEVISQFARKRAFYVRQHILEYFGLTDTVQIELNISPPGTGQLQINSVVPDSLPWRGVYFADVPIHLSARAEKGYRFVRWSGSITDSSAHLQLTPDRELTLTAEFEPLPHVQTPIRITELNYASAASIDPGDWLELYNAGTVPVNLGNWILMDSDTSHRFVFPPVTVGPNQYLVVCRDTAKFRTVFPDVHPLVGDLPFGFDSKGDECWLLTTENEVAFFFAYKAEPPWPVEASGSGATLALISPDADPTDPANWYAAAPPGTPGKKNGPMVGVRQDPSLLRSFQLLQNFPNPFREATTFRVALPSPARIKAIIYDVRGRQVARLLDREAAAGLFSFGWHPAPDLPSGIYFVRVQVGKKTVLKKKLLLLH